ncbi:MAG: peptidoglycan-binding protein [Minisyncoccia bacterium]
MKKMTFVFRFGLMVLALIVGGFFITNLEAAITSTFIANETVANLTAVNDQDAVTATPVANVPAGVNDQAAVTATPQANSGTVAATITVDTNITVTADVAGSAGNTFSIEVVQSTSNNGASTNATIVITKTGSDILATVVHNSHPNADGSNPINVTRASVVQALNMSASGAVQGGFVTVTITNDVTSDITASGGDASTVGTVGVTSLAGGTDATAQINTITISGTPEEGDVFTATLPTVGAVNYTVLVTDTTNDLIATGLNTAIQTSLGYAGQDFTSGVATNVITLTAKVAGVGFTQTSGATNRTAISQVVTFTPASVTAGETFRVTINGTPYNYLATGGNTVQSVVEALAPLVDANADVACSEDDIKITCSASSAGTAFIYASTVVDITPPDISLVSFSPDNGTAKIGDVITLNITADQIGYVEDAITINGEAVAGFTDNANNSYSVTYTVVAGDTNRTAGNVPVSVVLEDNNLNSNVAYTDVIANTLAIDAEAPTLDSAETTSTTTIDVTFSEDLNGATVTNADFNVTGYTLTAPDAFEFAPGVVRLTVTVPFATSETPAINYTGSVTDLAGNPAPVAGPVIPSDGVAPVISEVTPVPTPDNDSTPDYTFSSGEAGAITVGGDCVLPASAAVVGPNTITFDSLSDGPHTNCTITVTDVSTNVSNILDVSDFTIDTVPPDVTISSTETDPTNTSPVPFTATFSEDVTGFSGADIDLVNGILSSFVPASATVYNFGVVPVIQGLMTVDIDINSAIDTAGNNSTAATQFGITYDSVSPVIAEVTPVPPLDTDDTPDYTFSSDEAGDITYGGGCSSGTASASAGSNTVTFDSLLDGTYNCTVRVTDAAGNLSNLLAASAFTIDTTDPTLTSVNISSNNANTAYAKVGDTVTLAFSSSEDIQTPVVTIGGNVAVVSGGPTAWSATYIMTGGDTEGTVAFTIDFSDIVGNAGTTVTAVTDASSVTFDRTAPVIDSHSDETEEATSGLGAVVNYTSPDATDNIDATASATCSPVSGSTFALGTTLVTCDKADTAGNVATSETFDVIVEDTTAPDITMLGVSPVDVQYGSVYVDAGATALDIVDGDLTGSIVVTNPVDTSVLGAYTVRYNVSDAATNAATEVTRTVNVIPRDLTVTATGIDKTYDNTTVATVDLFDNRVAGDIFTATYTSASFANDAVGTSIPVSVVGIAISGADAGNYNLLNTTANTTANINSPSSSGGGSRSRTPSNPAPGEVLGAETGPQFVFTLLLKQGVVAPAEVMELQKFLNTAGYGPLVVDGKFGPLTKAAVVKFQLANGLKGDGIVGPLTRAVLNK